MVVLGVGGTVAAFCLFGGLGGLVKTGPSDPLEAIPRASFIAATLDFAELRRSPVYEVFFGKEAPGADPMRRALGVSALAEACGFDPATRVQRVAVSVPEEGDRGEFGVAAKVEVTRDELETCTRALADKRGGHAETHDVGSFVVLEDTSTGAGSAARPRLAYGRGGLLVVGKGTWFDAMLGAADHTKPGLRDAAEHVALRASLTSHDGFRAPTLLATAILPRSLRDRLKGEMNAEAGSQDTSSVIMAGVLGVSAVGVAIKAGGPGQNVDASVELVCDDAAACEAVDRLAQKKRGEWSRDLTLRMIGFGQLLDSFEVKRDGARLRATASVSADALASTIERVLKLRARQGAGVAPPPRPSMPGVPDETLRARPDGATDAR
ncbi:MAG: hypothetical protein JWO86_8357 [Myxococcaceae bacterium]|nr:hypothetical protein [Myxococcaceae bacterium]